MRRGTEMNISLPNLDVSAINVAADVWRDGHRFGFIEGEISFI